MTIKVQKREFLSKKADDVTSVSWEVVVPDTNAEYEYPNMIFKISDGGKMIYLEVYGNTKGELNESLGEIVALRDNLDEFIELIKDNQKDILKASV